MPRRDCGGRLRVGETELRQVALDRLVEVDPAFLVELHHEQRCVHLGDGSNVEEAVSGRFHAGGHVEDAGGGLGEHVALADGDRRAGNSVPSRHIDQPLRELGQERHVTKLTSQINRWYSNRPSTPQIKLQNSR